jgi:hypothetical protein
MDVPLDISKLCVNFCSNIYDIGIDKYPLPLTYDLLDKEGHTRRYLLTRYKFWDFYKSELCCLYTAVCQNPEKKEKDIERFAFIVWKGTWSVGQALLDVRSPFVDQNDWRRQLTGICNAFFPKLKEFLKLAESLDEIIPSQYTWYITGHSLGGALSCMMGAMLEADPALLPIPKISKIITFASMKLPVPVYLPTRQADDDDFAHKNNVIEYYSRYDRLPEIFNPGGSADQHIGKIRIEIGYQFAMKDLLDVSLYNLYLFPVPHSLANYRHFFDKM